MRSTTYRELADALDRAQSPVEIARLACWAERAYLAGELSWSEWLDVGLGVAYTASGIGGEEALAAGLVEDEEEPC